MKTTRLFPIVFLAFGLMITPNILRADEAPESTNTAPKQAVVPAVPEDTDFTMIEVEFPVGRKSDRPASEPPEGMEWRLVWHDEFDGDEIDWENKWSARNTRVSMGIGRKGSFLTGNGFLKMSVIKEGRIAIFPAVCARWGNTKRSKAFCRPNEHPSGGRSLDGFLALHPRSRQSRQWIRRRSGNRYYGKAMVRTKFILPSIGTDMEKTTSGSGR